jgi:phosphatidylserine decarboxylase
MSVKFSFPQLYKDGYFFVAIGAVVASIMGMIWEPLGWICVIITLWLIYFFRDPDRVVPIGKDFVVSPADGVVANIEDVEVPSELGIKKETRTRVSIFLNIFDVHVNRVPCEGRITKIVYHPGKFFNASLDKASTDNERNHVVMEIANKKTLIFTQIAGLIARRIVCDLKEGQEVKTGQRYGVIKFSSRMDIFLPVGELPKVNIGQRVISGETILCILGDKEKVKCTVR